MRQIALLPSLIAEQPADLAAAVVAASDRQVDDKGIEDAVGRDEFGVSSDALNYHRIVWRCAEEWGEGEFDRQLAREVKGEICRRRGYDPDDFESALLATKARARLPFGWTALDLARFRARLNPIRLLDGDLAESRLATEIAAIALQLQHLQKEKAILLPIEQLREMFAQRKVVVSGAVMRLVEAGILRCVDEKYHTGKAREFMFIGEEHRHFEVASPP
ncbi:hypothetical protein P12x_005216 [Tundrisphaera lichenicola]|uniref:hypothetical protein n=1 Tax=Tundrisphaera lichenicola TaxID=2029860 RepID=UPI003EB9031D